VPSQRFGTPAYQAPELIRGEAPTKETDLFALGVVAYECLAGHPPFAAASDRGSQMKRLLDPPAPLREAAPAVMPELEALVLELLEKRPGLRPKSAAEVARRLRAIDHPEPKSAELKSAEVNSAEVNSAEVNSAEVKSAEVKSAEVKSAEVNSAEAKSSDAKSAEANSAEVRSAEANSTEVRSAEVRAAGPSSRSRLQRRSTAWRAAMVLWRAIAVLAVAAYLMFRSSPKPRREAPEVTVRFVNTTSTATHAR
jgi:serine/threonine-protein kinase